MKKFIKDNWFKIIILLLITGFISGYLCIQLKEHNRKAVNDMYSNCKTNNCRGYYKNIFNIE